MHYYTKKLSKSQGITLLSQDFLSGKSPCYLLENKVFK